MICYRSQDDDLIMIGFRYETLKKLGTEMFDGYGTIGNILFVHASNAKHVTKGDELELPV